MTRGASRREVVAGLAASVACAACGDRGPRRSSAAPPAPKSPRLTAIDLIEAPNNLGLRPLRPGVEPGAWRAPAALDRAGLAGLLRAARHVRLARRPYQVDAQPGTRIRNGLSLRDFSLGLAAEVASSLARGALPVVVGGDCSDLLGCMLGLRRAGGRGLVHLDGHADFFHPGNYDSASRLGSAAGMDLALATGRGEPTLARWPGVDGALVADADVVQIGERGAGDPGYPYPDIRETAIERVPIERIRAGGIAAAAAAALARLGARGIERAWVHIDLDVLDAWVMPAVDSPGSPGLTFAELAELLAALLRSGRVAGLDVAIYDPDMDPGERLARPIAAAIAAGLAPILGGEPAR